MKTMIKFTIASLVSISVLCVAGCNTMAGVGKDMQAGGQALTHSANKNR